MIICNTDRNKGHCVKCNNKLDTERQILQGGGKEEKHKRREEGGWI
jgi:hypothetical protein